MPQQAIQDEEAKTIAQEMGEDDIEGAKCVRSEALCGSRLYQRVASRSDGRDCC